MRYSRRRGSSHDAKARATRATSAISVRRRNRHRDRRISRRSKRITTAVGMKGTINFTSRIPLSLVARLLVNRSQPRRQRLGSGLAGLVGMPVQPDGKAGAPGWLSFGEVKRRTRCTMRSLIKSFRLKHSHAASTSPATAARSIASCCSCSSSANLWTSSQPGSQSRQAQSGAPSTSGWRRGTVRPARTPD